MGEGTTHCISELTHNGLSTYDKTYFMSPFSSGIHIAMLESKGRDVVALCAAANYAAAKALAKKGGTEKEEEEKDEKEENTHCRQILGFEGGIQTTLHTCVLAPSLASSRGLPNIEVDVTLPPIYIEADTALINNTMRMIESLVDEHTGSGGSGGEGGGGGETKEAGGASSLDINSGGTGVDAGGGTVSGAILVSSSSVLLQVFTTRGDDDSTDLTAGGGGVGGAGGGAPLPPTTTSIRVGASVSRAELSVEVNLGESIIGSSHGGGATRLVTVFAEELAVEHEGAVGGESVTRASLNQFAVVDEISGPLDAQQQWERGGQRGEGGMGGGARYMLRTIGTTKEGKEGKEQARVGVGVGGTEEELKKRRTGEAGVPVLAGMTALSPDAFVNLELVLRPARPARPEPEGGRVEGGGGGGEDERAVNVSRLDISVVTGHVEVLVDMRTVDLLWRFVLVDVVFVDEAKWFRSGVKAGVKVQQQRRRNQLHLHDAKEGETLPSGTGEGTSPAVVSPSSDTSGASSSSSASASTSSMSNNASKKPPPPPPPAVTVRAALASLSGSLQGSRGDVAHLHVSAVDVRLKTRPRPLAGSPVGGCVEGHANVHYHRALEMSLAGDAATICGGSRDGFPLLVGLSAKQTKRKTKKGARVGASAGDKQGAPQQEPAATAVANPVRGMFSGALSESDDSSVLASDDEGDGATRAPLQAQDSITLDMSEEDYDDDDDDDDDSGGGGVEAGTVVLEMEEDSEEGEGTDEGDERRDESRRGRSTSSESMGSLGKRGLVVALSITEGHSLSSSSSSSLNRPPSQHVNVNMRMGSVRAQVAAPVVLRIVETVLEVVRYRLL